MEFERRIMASEANNAKFNFLGAADPYHAYYRMRVRLQGGIGGTGVCWWLLCCCAAGGTRSSRSSSCSSSVVAGTAMMGSISNGNSMPFQPLP
jgi:hypothetical protein